MTDITISIEELDRLAKAAASDGTSLQSYLKRLAEAAAAEHMSLRTYLRHLARKAMTPEQRAEEAARVREMLREWNGYDPTPEEEAALDADLDRQFAAIRRQRGRS